MIFDDCERAARTFAAEKDRADASMAKMISALETLRKGARPAEKADRPDVLEVVGLIDNEIGELRAQVQALAEKAAGFRQAMESPIPDTVTLTAKGDDSGFWLDVKARVNQLYDDVREMVEKADGPFGSMFRRRVRRQPVAQKSDEERTGLDVFGSMFGQ